MKRQTPDKDYPDGKWKMIFTKDQKRADMKPSTSKGIMSKQYPFMGDSEDSDHEDNNLGQPTQSASSSGSYYKARDDDKRRRSSPHAQKKYEVTKPSAKATPVVLDKFGSFRLATTDRTSPKVIGQFQRKSRSRSKSRKHSSSSHSRSRTPPRRRSRSLSYPKRRYSRSASRSRSRSYRSRSKSYSRSRSRSRSGDRHRFDKRSFRGGYDRDRGSNFYKSRFNPRGGFRGRGGSGFRDTRDFRGRGRDRPFRPRGGRGGYIPRGRDHRDRRYDRDGSYDRNSDRESNYERRDRFSRRSSKEKRRSNTPPKVSEKGRADDMTTSALTGDN